MLCKIWVPELRSLPLKIGGIRFRFREGTHAREPTYVERGMNPERCQETWCLLDLNRRALAGPRECGEPEYTVHFDDVKAYGPTGITGPYESLRV